MIFKGYSVRLSDESGDEDYRRDMLLTVWIQKLLKA